MHKLCVGSVRGSTVVVDAKDIGMPRVPKLSDDSGVRAAGPAVSDAIGTSLGCRATRQKLLPGEKAA